MLAVATSNAMFRARELFPLAGREDQQIGVVEAAQQVVEVDQPGGQPGQAAVAPERRLGHRDRLGERRPELDEAALGLAALGEVEQVRLGLLDLLGGRAFQVAVERVVDDRLADLDELAAQVAVADLAAVILGVDDRHHRGGEADQIGRPPDFLQRLVLVEHALEGDRGGDLAAVDQPAAGLEDAAVHRIGEVLDPQELRHPLVGAVVHQHGAEQRLLGLQVVRRLAARRRCLRQFDLRHGRARRRRPSGCPRPSGAAADRRPRPGRPSSAGSGRVCGSRRAWRR